MTSEAQETPVAPQVSENVFSASEVIVSAPPPLSNLKPTEGAILLGDTWFTLSPMTQEQIHEWTMIRFMVKWRQVQTWRRLQFVISGLIPEADVADEKIMELSEEIHSAGNILVFKALRFLETNDDTKIAAGSTFCKSLPTPDKEKVIALQDHLNGLDALADLETISQGIYTIHKQTVIEEAQAEENQKKAKKARKAEKSERRRTRQLRANQEPIRTVNPFVVPTIEDTFATKPEISGDPITPSALPPVEDRPAHILWKPLKTHGIPDPSKRHSQGT